MSIAALAALTLFATQPAPEVELWRLDCGTIEEKQFALYSDTYRYEGRGYRLANSCYLIRHGSDYMLWDTGLSGDLVGNPLTEDSMTLTLNERIVPQLARIGVKPAQIRFIGISHRHWDHTGQAGDFPGATLLIGKPDLEALRGTTDADSRAGVAPWLGTGAKSEGVERDHDVFGDGSVVMLAMPGHTPGHHALLVRLGKTGPVLLSGDQFHARESYETNDVPAFNADRADTLASSDRFRAIARNLKALVIIQHEPGDIAKLPKFPESAR